MKKFLEILLSFAYFSLMGWGLALIVVVFNPVFDLSPKEFSSVISNIINLFIVALCFAYIVVIDRIFVRVGKAVQRYELKKEQTELEQSLFEQEAALSYRETPADLNQTKSRLAEVKANLAKLAS